MNMEQTVNIVTHWIDNNIKKYICIRDVHGIVCSLNNPELRKIQNNAGLCVPDGMPNVLLGKYYGYTSIGRVRGADLMSALSKASVTRKYRHFYYGGKPGVSELLKACMNDKYPEIQIVGTYTPPFRELSKSEQAELIKYICDLKPDIIWVGLSTPKQEYWMAEYLELLDCKIVIGVGAAFDFHAGLVSEAPKLIQNTGFEWLFRIMMEPRRLWRRYLRTVPVFLFHIICQLSGIRKYKIIK